MLESWIFGYLGSSVNLMKNFGIFIFYKECIMSSAQDFYLQELNILVDADQALLHGGEDTTSFDASANATLKIPVSHARRLFQYQADAIDVTDLNSSDIRFRMFHLESDLGDITSNSGNLKFFNSKNVIPAEAEVVLNQIPFYGSAEQNENEKKINADFVRYVAKEVFGVPVTDLFSNERTVRNGIIKDSADNYVAKIQELVDFRVTLDGSANQYVPIKTSLITDPSDAETATNFPARLVFSQLLNSVQERFLNLDTFIDPNNSPVDVSENMLHLFNESGVSTSADALGSNLWRYMPLMVGDSIYFKLTINPHADQEQVTTVASAAGTDIAPHSYRVRMLLVADDDAKVADSSNESSTTNYWRAWNQSGWDSTQKLHYLADAQHTNETTANITTA
jgi:hypothetical protein